MAPEINEQWSDGHIESSLRKIGQWFDEGLYSVSRQTLLHLEKK